MMNSGGGGGGNRNNDTMRTAHHHDAVVNDDEQPTVVREDDDNDHPHHPQKEASFSIIVRFACGYGTLGLFLIVAFLAAGFGLSYYRRHDDDDDNGSSTANGVNDDWSDDNGETYQARYRLFRSYAGQLSSNDELALLQTNTPQAQALDWLVHRDASSMSRTDTAIYDPTLLQRFAVRYALLVLYYACGVGSGGSGTATTGPKDDNKNDGSSSLWGGDRAQDTCDWPFVTCHNDGDNERVVVAVELHGEVLTGQLPVELALLSKLTRLDLSDNALEGTVPATLLAGLTNLGTYVTP